jgi:hypothetical protein
VFTPDQIGDAVGQNPPSVTSDVGDPGGGDGTGGGPPLGNPDITLWDNFEVYGGFLGYTRATCEKLRQARVRNMRGSRTCVPIRPI